MFYVPQLCHSREGGNPVVLFVSLWMSRSNSIIEKGTRFIFFMKRTIILYVFSIWVLWIPAFPPKADPPQADAGMTGGKYRVSDSSAAERT